MLLAMKKLTALLFLLMVGYEALPCVTCNRPVQNAIADSASTTLLLQIFLPFLVLGAITAYLYYRAMARPVVLAVQRRFPYAAAFVVLGIGMGGFIDGIVLHQILQWHEMLSNRIPPTTLIAKSLNMFWDGIFHLFTLAVTFIGILMLYQLIKRKEHLVCNCLFGGGLLLGWGIFNLVEGLLNHHIFQLHHVKEFSPDYHLWDMGFTLLSVIMVIAGWLLIRKCKKNQPITTAGNL
jgi:uncharacterized membrane protein